MRWMTVTLWTLLAWAQHRASGLRREPERGDENITKVIYAALAVTLGVLIMGAITAYVNDRLPEIGGG